ncbi:unnamed protein product [Nippostrongylus brasiliensis]|uniref:YTH domain-containing protein n=1 Tax=Nippostrongylus brasiliensis TaxID=27835 RepID=A0A0N4YAM2_NIPBR|nr:unnamed protein product [Nippostrongylus brasiliensis]
MFANGPDQQFYHQTPPAAPSQQQQQQPTPTQQQQQSVIVRQPDLPDDHDDIGGGYAASTPYYGLAPSTTVVPNAYSTPYNMNMPIPFLFGDWNQLGMVNLITSPECDGLVLLALDHG